MDTIIVNMVDLLIAALAVGFIARRLKLPYTVGLVAAGFALAFTRIEVAIPLTHDFIFVVILPPLLFEAAINLHWRELRRDALPILILAIAGTVLAAAAMTAGLVLLLHWPLRPALLFGVLIAATDPVAVIAMFRDNAVHGRPRLLVESESLFNDGVAAVLFTLVVQWVLASDTATGAPDVMRTLLATAGGGVMVGLAAGMMAIAVFGQSNDHLIESALTTICAYGSFLLAEHMHVSGVLATVSAGLITGNLGLLSENGSGPVSARGREFVLDLWAFIAFIANSVVFLLIGLAMARIAFQAMGLEAIGVIIGLGLLARAVTVYPLCLLFARSRWRIAPGIQHLLWWGGLRGALSLALALSLPDQTPFHAEILIATFATVGFSVIVQGLTMPRLLRALGLAT